MPIFRPPIRVLASFSKRAHMPCLPQRMNNCRGWPPRAELGQNGAVLLQQNTAELVQRRSFRRVLPRIDTASISGLHTYHVSLLRSPRSVKPIITKHRGSFVSTNGGLNGARILRFSNASRLHYLSAV
jgi:hypothetical protein